LRLYDIEPEIEIDHETISGGFHGVTRTSQNGAFI